MKSMPIESGKAGRWSQIAVAGIAFLIVYFSARYGMSAWAPPEYWDIVVMSAPLFAFYWLFAVVQRALRDSDELQRRIHLEAFALAFVTVALALMGLGLIEETPRGRIALPLRDLWFALIPLYGICYLAARHHYR